MSTLKGVMMDLPESFLSKVKSSGSPPMNTPVFSPITVLPLEADALPGDGGAKKSVELHIGKSKYETRAIRETKRDAFE